MSGCSVPGLKILVEAGSGPVVTVGGGNVRCHVEAPRFACNGDPALTGRRKGRLRTGMIAPTARHPHRPYASMNWIRFIGSLRCLAASSISAPCRDPPGGAVSLAQWQGRCQPPAVARQRRRSEPPARRTMRGHCGHGDGVAGTRPGSGRLFPDGTAPIPPKPQILSGREEHGGSGSGNVAAPCRQDPENLKRGPMFPVLG